METLAATTNGASAWMTTVATAVGVMLGQFFYAVIVAIARWNRER